MCLVAFQKNFRKTFSDVWLYSWKYHRKHIFYLLLTFSHIFSATKQSHNVIHSFLKTQIKPRKHHIFSMRSRSARSRSRLTLRARSRSQSRRFRWSRSRDRDRDRRRSAQFRWPARSRLWCVGVDRSIWLGVWSEQWSFERGSVCLREECVWERNGKRLKWKFGLKLISVGFGLFYGQTENIFSLTQFTMPTKHVIFLKMISEFRF